MNPLVKKEIRLLLPGFLIGVALTFANGFLKADQSLFNGLIVAVSFVSCSAIAVFMALNSFGAEISSGTFSMLLAQPVSRQRIWRTKTLLLAAALFIGGLLWCDLLYSGALWTVLLLRQMAAAFWFTLLTPGAIVMLIAGLWPEKYPDACEPVVIAALLVYSLTGFWFARRLFYQAQDVAWTGGNITWPEMRGLKWWGECPREPQATFDIDSSAASPHRTWRPKAALFWKELQLHQSQFVMAGVLALLHLGIIATRKFGHFPQNSSLEFVLEQFWCLWLVMSALVGCAAVAEERKQGVMEGQLCLPVSRHTQFAIKFIPTMIFGTLLGGVMPLLLEAVAAHIGVRNDFFKPENYANNEFGFDLVGFQISIMALAVGLAWVGFFASTLARNFLQAISIAIGTILSCVPFVPLVALISKQQATFFGLTPWHPLLPILIAIPTILTTLLWLAYLNFKHFHENWHLWRRNLLGLTGALLFIIVSSAAIYNRAWEAFEPVEPAHGKAKFSLALHSDQSGNLLVQLPDGRVWFNSLSWNFFENQSSRWKELWLELVPPLPKSAGPQQFIAGSNWVSVTASHIDWWATEGATNIHILGYRDTVGVQADGTLWISSEAKPIIWTGAKMIRFGDGTNWKKVVRRGSDFLLLKKDGTLWLWGTNNYSLNQWQTNWPSMRAFRPQQIGTNSDWKEIFNAAWSGSYAQKTDGSVWVWSIHSNRETGKDELERQTNLDQVEFQTFSRISDIRMAYVGKDGTLWVCNQHAHFYGNTGTWEGTGFLQVGKETNWLAVAVSWPCMVALKSDGSLWKWDFPQNSTAEVAKTPPTRLGIHNDWVGLTGTWDGVVSLAADGSLWLWPVTIDSEYYRMALLKPPKQPKSLGNVFGKAD